MAERTARGDMAREARGMPEDPDDGDTIARAPEAPIDGGNGGADPADAEEPAEAEEAPGSAPAEGVEEPAEAASEEEPAEAVAEEEPVTPAPKAKAPKARPAGKKPQSPDEVLDDLAETHKFALAEAEYHVQRGNEAWDELDYKTAMDEYRKALNINPALPEVRERWARAGLVLGIRSAEVDSIHKEFVEGDKVRKEQRLADARLGLKEARDLMGSGDYENAEKKFRKVHEELLWFDFPEDVTDLQAAAKKGIDDVGEKKRAHAREARASLERTVGEQKERDLQRERQVREGQIRELVRRAADYIRLKDYDKAIDACNRILELNPDHRVAKFWLRDMERQQMNLRKLTLYRDQQENRKLLAEGLTESAIPRTESFVFPGEVDWNRIRRRGETLGQISLEDPEWIRKIKNALEGNRLTFSFEKRPLKEVLPFLAEQTGINIVSDPAIDTETITIDLTVKDMSAANALGQIMTLTNLAYTFQENTLYITEKEKAKGEVKFDIYNVSDILNRIREFEGPAIRLKTKEEGTEGGAGTGMGFTAGAAEEAGPPDPQALIDLIQEGSPRGVEDWTDPNKIEYHKGQLMVTATTQLHETVQNTLKKLREDSDLFVVIEARFIDIKDDFLEDIGIDTRGLGAVNNFGTPYGNVINNSSTGGNDLGFVKQGSPVRDVTLIKGQDRYGGRVQHIIDGFTGMISGTNLTGGTGGLGGLTAQMTWLEPFQINVILRAVQEKSDVRELTAPIITAHNGQRVFVSVITQRAYIADYELVSGGTGYSIIEVADPVVQTFQEGVILDVDPVISPDKRYITMDVRPTLATLIGGIISTIHISLGSFTNVAFQVPIGVPQISLQQSYTSVTVPNGGTVLLGGFKSMTDARYTSYIPILGKIPLIKNLFRRKATIIEKRSLVILITARIIDLRQDESTRYNE